MSWFLPHSGACSAEVYWFRLTSRQENCRKWGASKEFQETAVAYFNVLSFKRRKSHKDLSQDSSWVRDPKTLNLNMTEEKRENEGLVR